MIEAVARGLIDRTLPKAEWTHTAHFAAALWLLRHDDAYGRMPGLIRAYNAATGTPNTDAGGYHETITLASLRAARACLAARAEAEPDVSLADCLNALLAGPCGRSDWLLAYWSRELLFSPAARRAWVEPDIQPLPY